jgi:hypothetical protein
MKQELWMFVSSLYREEIFLAVPTIAWVAREAGIPFECYLESQRDGRLFAETGSTVLGGHHHQQFNYLNARYSVKYILLGDTSVFRSSIDAFGAEIIAEENALPDLYAKVFAWARIPLPGEALFARRYAWDGDARYEVGPYAHSDISFGRLLGLLPDEGCLAYAKSAGVQSAAAFCLGKEDLALVAHHYNEPRTAEALEPGDGYGSLTVRIARRNAGRAKGVAFGDPAAIMAQLASLCRDGRISVYGAIRKIPNADVVYNAYTEEATEIAEDVIELCDKIGNHVIVGRQTGDGDLFAWARGGVCMQIMDPNRPAFPIVQAISHPWRRAGRSCYSLEPDDATLERYCSEGKILASMIFHSGEMAHNEAMLNLFELSAITGVKLGVGVHASRYESCPQMWELLQTPASAGGVLGQIEPLLHTGGMGIMAEISCPPAFLAKHAMEAMGRIEGIAGEEGLPKGYYAFADTDLQTLTAKKEEIYTAVEECGLDYFISSVLPGRNQLIHAGSMVALNQTSRSQCLGSPFVRVTTVEDLKEGAIALSPGWMLGTLDSPVISFNPYIWRHGSRFMRIVDWLMQGGAIVNATPHTVARYARLLYKKGMVPLYSG